MKIAVVTPYFESNPDWLGQAHESVRRQDVPAHHILVCDGSAPVQIDGFQGTHIILPRNYRDYGNTPRLIGCYQAVTMGCDAIAFLDADNWYAPRHLQRLSDFAETGGYDVCASAIMLHRLDGSPMAKFEQVNGRDAIDTNSLMVLAPAFRHLLAWTLVPQAAAGVADQKLWMHMMGHGAKFGFLDDASVSYRTRHAYHYRDAGEQPPSGAIIRHDPHGDKYQ